MKVRKLSREHGTLVVSDLRGTVGVLRRGKLGKWQVAPEYACHMNPDEIQEAIELAAKRYPSRHRRAEIRERKGYSFHRRRALGYA